MYRGVHKNSSFVVLFFYKFSLWQIEPVLKHSQLSKYMTSVLVPVWNYLAVISLFEKVVKGQSLAIDNSKLRKNLIPDNLKIFGLISLSLKYTDIFKTADFEQKDVSKVESWRCIFWGLLDQDILVAKFFMSVQTFNILRREINTPVPQKL